MYDIHIVYIYWIIENTYKTINTDCNIDGLDLLYKPKSVRAFLSTKRELGLKEWLLFLNRSACKILTYTYIYTADRYVVNLKFSDWILAYILHYFSAKLSSASRIQETWLKLFPMHTVNCENGCTMTPSY